MGTEEENVMDAKFHMTLEQNIFVAKRNIVDYIWKSAKLEGLGVTYPDTEAIYNGMSAPNVKVSDIIAVNNLKHAWQFILDHIEYEIDYPFICKINQVVGSDNLIVNAGLLRNVSVSIGGTAWKPEIPSEPEVKEQLTEVLKIESPTQRGISLMLHLMRQQLFLDGNKRTAMLAANQVMIANGCGIISIPIEKLHSFTKLLVEFYETGNMETIQEFVYQECIDGIDFRPTISQEQDGHGEIQI